ncbi:MAG TPA: TetR/AcrR family transcriptional regulator [Burkholderiaceae bacterium]|nr:TetR/AcrR family transcriptional regulator [Burkholderiaceae bacterium]
MGRSSQQKAAENRERIVDCACTLFRERGVDNVSVADVMAANGMTVGGFYKHFESKDALIEEAFARTFGQSADTWEKVFEAADAKGGSRTSELVRRYLRNSAPERRCPILAFAPHVTTSDSAAGAAEAYACGTQGLFERFVEGERGAPGDDRQAAMLLFAAMVGARVIEQAVGKAPWVQEMLAAVRDFADR